MNFFSLLIIICSVDCSIAHLDLCLSGCPLLLPSAPVWVQKKRSSTDKTSSAPRGAPIAKPR